MSALFACSVSASIAPISAWNSASSGSIAAGALTFCACRSAGSVWQAHPRPCCVTFAHMILAGNSYLQPALIQVVEALLVGLGCLAVAAILPGPQPSITRQAEAAKPRRTLRKAQAVSLHPIRKGLQHFLITQLTAPEQIEKMQPGFYLPVLLDHKVPQAAYPVQGSTTWPRLALFVSGCFHQDKSLALHERCAAGPDADLCPIA